MIHDSKAIKNSDIINFFFIAIPLDVELIHMLLPSANIVSGILILNFVKGNFLAAKRLL